MPETAWPTAPSREETLTDYETDYGEDLIDLTWRLEEEGGGEAVGHVEGPDGEPLERSFHFEGLDDPHLPDRVAEIMREDGRRFGVWTRS